MGNSHQIEIRGLRVATRIGVPDEERASAQEVKVDVRITVATGFAEMDDQIGRTLDYADLAGRIRELAGSGERRLIETLASDIAGLVLGYRVAAAVEVSIEKFILPETDCVAVHLRREATSF
ncbi:dihydroneopterin aldolase [Luteolibacter marinus]|uniref:dihydroneopterin aldolase n=1 Tax=Luteolibacter marinus TaxID=2776705 RepID=UPI001D01EA17|nr:dihydroneopterin aldolase [Luteolibacter marinus]